MRFRRLYFDDVFLLNYEIIEIFEIIVYRIFFSPWNYNSPRAR